MPILEEVGRGNAEAAKGAEVGPPAACLNLIFKRELTEDTIPLRLVISDLFRSRHSGEIDVVRSRRVLEVGWYFPGHTRALPVVVRGQADGHAVACIAHDVGVQ